MGVDTQQLQGFDDLIAKLRAIPVALQKRELRNALAAGGRLVRDEAKRLSEPVLKTPAADRTPGTVRNAIKLRSSKEARREGKVGVFINVKPAPGAKFKTTTRRALGVKVRSRKQVRASQRGANSRTDPFYWRWLEFGWNPGAGDRSRAGKKARRDANKQGLAKRVPGRHFLRDSAHKFPDALRAISARLERYFEKMNATGQVPK